MALFGVVFWQLPVFVVVTPGTPGDLIPFPEKTP